MPNLGKLFIYASLQKNGRIQHTLNLNSSGQYGANHNEDPDLTREPER